MQYELSATFAKIDHLNLDFQEVWKKLCHDFLMAVFPTNSIVRINSDEYGIDLLDQTTGTAYCCHAVDDPSSDTLSVDNTISSLERAVKHRDQLGWKRYNISMNTEYSDEGMNFINNQMRKIQINSEEVGFLGPGIWNRLCSEYPRIVMDWFDYRVIVSKDAVKKAFEDARYYPKNVAKYAAQIAETNFNVILTNNRTPLELVLPFSPQLTVEHLLDVGKVLFDLSLDATDFRDLGTSARLSLSVNVDGFAQEFSKLLAEVPVPSGGQVQIWIKIIWEENSFDEPAPDDGLPIRNNFLLHESFAYYRLSCQTINFEVAKDIILGHKPAITRGTIERGSTEEKTLARKVALITSCIWHKAKILSPAKRKTSQTLDYSRRIPVRLGASAPEIVNPGANFLVHFVAYHPDLEIELQKQLNQLASDMTHRLDSARANWEIGTKVKVRVYRENLIVDPEEDEFQWGGEKHILDFRVKVAKRAMGPRDLKFDVYVENYRICRIWMPLEVSYQSSDRMQNKTVSSPQTAFASYATEDRLRVLDRVATLEIHCGLRVFLDCISMRPNAKWRELIPEMVLESDQLLLFWSKAARDSTWVDKEWRIAFKQKGIDGIEIHPLSTYDEAGLPQELAELVHGADPTMVIRTHEERKRSSNIK